MCDGFFFLPLLKKENFKVNDEMKNCEGFLCNGLCIKIRIFWGGDGVKSCVFLWVKKVKICFSFGCDGFRPF